MTAPTTAENAQAIINELERFSPTLHGRERWLLLNKIDMLPEGEVEERCQAVIDKLQWDGPVHRIAAISRTGTKELCSDILDSLEARWAEEKEDPELAEAELAIQQLMQKEARERIEALRAQYRAQSRGTASEDDDDDWDDDDHDVEVEYAP